MSNNLITTLGFPLYTLAFIAITIGTGIWLIKRQRLKPPLDFNLLRAPGESLRRKISRDDENSILWFLGASMLPLMIGQMVISGLGRFAPTMDSGNNLIIAAAVSLLIAVPSVGLLIQQWLRARNDQLGYLGERAVGEALQPLATAGYRIFHDIPAKTEKLKFNVDHVAVGPNGVFAIETKTRRKGRARPGFEAHKVAYDGTRLIWPWGEDSWGLKNAEDRAVWLGKWLNKMTGLSIKAHPVLVLPGWYVTMTGIGATAVVNHKMIAGAIQRSSQCVFSSDQIDLIARQLDSLCRDVKD